MAELTVVLDWLIGHQGHILMVLAFVAYCVAVFCNAKFWGTKGASEGWRPTDTSLVSLAAFCCIYAAYHIVTEVITNVYVK